MFNFFAKNPDDISPLELKTILDTNKACVLLDVGSLREHQSGKIVNSILVPVEEIEKKAVLLLPDINTEIYLYCASGARSSFALKLLRRMGYTKLKNLEGGISNWLRHKLPVIR